jgi:transcriptional regulator with XRE-family HTH domain
MQARADAAVLLGSELRHGRIACRKRQRDVAAEIGGSQSMISRMELGHGASVPLATWAAAADAVDRRLVVDLIPPRQRPDDGDESVARRCHRTIAEAARAGGWSVVTEVHNGARPERIETILQRAGRELAVVHAWDLVTEVGTAIRELTWSMERERRRIGEGWRIGGLVIVRAGLGNRRRMTEAGAQLSVAFPTLAAHWFRALRREVSSMPGRPGVLWASRTGDRLLPAPLVPGWMWVSPDRASRALQRPRGA